MSDKRCCVPQCSESEHSHKVLHSFPNPQKDIERFRTWVHTIGGDILSLSNENIYKLRRVCRAHFEERYLCRSNRLSNIAMPTLFMPGLPISKLTKKRSFKEVENLLSTSCSESANNSHDNERKIQHVDHTYCSSEAVEDPYKTDNNEMDNDGCDAFISEVLKKHSQIENTELEIPEVLENCFETNNIEMDMDVTSPLPTEYLDLPSTSNVGEAEGVPVTDRIVHSTSSNKESVRTQILQSKYQTLRRKYKNIRRRLDTHIRAKKTLKYSKEKFFCKLTKNMNPLAKRFFWIQVQQSSKKAKGRRFSEDDKLLAMAIMEQSPKCYRFLQSIFILPSLHTLNKSTKSNTEEITGESFEVVEKEI